MTRHRGVNLIAVELEFGDVDVGLALALADFHSLLLLHSVFLFKGLVGVPPQRLFVQPTPPAGCCHDAHGDGVPCIAIRH